MKAKSKVFGECERIVIAGAANNQRCLSVFLWIAAAAQSRSATALKFVT